jgi:hypothetical protein
MMRKIYKYKLESSGVQYRRQADMPYGAGVLSVCHQDGDIVVYAEVEDGAYDFTQYFYAIPTGEEAPDDCEFLSTVVVSDEWCNFTFHVYKVL